MSKLLENIFKRRQQNVLSEFDMTKSGGAMLRHLGVSSYPYSEENELPIEPEATEWSHVQTDNKLCLQRTYKLETIKFLLYLYCLE